MSDKDSIDEFLEELKRTLGKEETEKVLDATFFDEVLEDLKERLKVERILDKQEAIDKEKRR